MKNKRIFSPGVSIAIILASIFCILYFGGKSLSLLAQVLLNEQAKIEGSLVTVAKTYASPQEGSFAPAFTLADTNGTELSLTDLRGKKTLLVFWATWCPYCRQELPSIKGINALYEDQFNIAAVTFTEDVEIVKTYQESNSIKFPVLIDEPGLVAEQYQINATPWHVFIDENGLIMRIVPGLLEGEDLTSVLEDLGFFENG